MHFAIWLPSNIYVAMVTHDHLCLSGGKCHQVLAAGCCTEEQQQGGGSVYPGGDHTHLFQDLPQCRHLLIYQRAPMEKTW